MALRFSFFQVSPAPPIISLQQVQERDTALSSLREELSSAAEQVELLTSQLDEARKKADPASLSVELKQVIEHTYAVFHTEVGVEGCTLNHCAPHPQC